MGDPPKLKVLLVDDHALAREGLCMALEITDEIACTEADSAERSLELLEAGTAFDLVLMDIAMPGMSGLDALKVICERFPQLPVLLHSMYPEEHYARRAADLGAIGYLSKGVPPAVILDVVKSAARGISHFPS
jgi:DNA-binding NarL/FixJ family response regulator